MKFTLKKDLLLGVATASAQIEGGDRNHNWARFSEEGKIADGSSILRADDHYNRWREDIDLMAEMGIPLTDVTKELAKRHVIDHKVKQEKMA